MPDAATVGARFLALHHGPGPLLLPNPWDAGSARLFEQLGFAALATTSSGFAASLGRQDGQVSREEALEHAARIVQATPLPVSADLEHGFGERPEDVAETYARAAGIGLAGASIEDSTGEDGSPILPIEAATERVLAAAESAHAAGVGFVLTGRAENHLHGRDDLADTIRRLQAYQEAGADVLFAPGLTDANDIRSVVTSVDRPVNVLFRPTGPTVAELADIGVARISVGGSIAFAAYGEAVDAAREFLERGTAGYFQKARVGRERIVELPESLRR